MLMRTDLALGQGHLCQPGAHPLPDVAYGEGDGVLVGAEVGETASGGEQHARQHRRVAVGLDAPRSTNHTSPGVSPRPTDQRGARNNCETRGNSWGSRTRAAACHQRVSGCGFVPVRVRARAPGPSVWRG